MKYVLLLMLSANVAFAGLPQKGPRARNKGGCACPCEADPVRVVVWKPGDGDIARFAARTIKSAYSARTSRADRHWAVPLILLGRSAKRVWVVETGGDEFSTNVVLVGIDEMGKRTSLHLVDNLAAEANIEPPNRSRALYSQILRAFGRLQRRGKWRPLEMSPLQLPLLSDYPRLALRESGEMLSGTSFNAGYSWTLRGRIKNGPWAVVASGKPNQPNGGDFYRGSRLVAGIADSEGAEIWWIRLAVALADNCGMEWRTVRFTPPRPKAIALFDHRSTLRPNRK